MKRSNTLLVKPCAVLREKTRSNSDEACSLSCVFLFINGCKLYTSIISVTFLLFLQDKSKLKWPEI